MLVEHVGSEDCLFQVGSRRMRTELGRLGAGRPGSSVLRRDQEFGFYSDCDGKSLEGFTQGQGLILLTLLIDYPAVWRMDCRRAE